MSNESYYVAVIGAGPSGMYAAREIARSGAKVVIFNRDIRPGGLAEYGIFLDKYSMKAGLRNQFQQILDTPGLRYCGNVVIGQNGDLTLDDLRELGFQAVLTTVGAQGTKWLGLPGEQLTGVYHAKDVVYHYNQLPPYSQKPFKFGKKVAIVGAGNVMLDITRYLIHHLDVEDVVAVVRRGPAEVKFDKKEMEYVIQNLDQNVLDVELARVTPQMQAIDQDPAAAKAMILEALPKAHASSSTARFEFSFLASPTQMLGDENGKVTGLEVEDNSLSLKDGEVKARGTGNKRIIDVDAVIFAIGDKVDESFGLPTQWNEFAKNPTPRFPVDGISYEAYNPETKTVIDDVFVAGWSRQASTGLVGLARKDGTNGAKVVLHYLQTLQPITPNETALTDRLKALDKPIITREDVRKLIEIEAAEAQKRGLEGFRYGTNEEMLQKIMAAE